MTGRVVEAAERASLRLTPPEVASVPAEFRRADGSSVFRPRYSTLYSSTDLFEAEARLLARARLKNGPSVSSVATARVLRAGPLPVRRLTAAQRAAVHAVTESGRPVEVLVGPPGAGKTTTMAALRYVWEARYGRVSVVGLAPSAAAADVLAGEVGITTENTAKWLHDHETGSAAFRPGQLVILDEASLAGTSTLDAITEHAVTVGAKVLLVGDPAQLQAVDAGGVFGLLARDRPDSPELTEVHRFAHGWEKTASLDLRHGRPAAIDAYAGRDRIRGGDTDTILDTAFQAWQTDRAAGLQTVLIAPTRDLVTALNQRSRAARILAGEVQAGSEVALAGEERGSVGDVAITRRNDRTRHAGRTGWIRNGDRWTITRIHPDGEVTIRRAGHRLGARVRVAASYVAEHLELGYAVTAHAAQGLTVDTAHAIAQPGTTRAQLYVALTRGRQANLVYVATDQPDPAHAGARVSGDPTLNAIQVLHRVLATSGAEQSAHEAIEAEQDRWGSAAQLVAEYETIAAAAQHERWVQLIHATPLTPEQADAVVDSEAFGPLCAAPAARRGVPPRRRAAPASARCDAAAQRCGRHRCCASRASRRSDNPASWSTATTTTTTPDRGPDPTRIRTDEDCDAGRTRPTRSAPRVHDAE